MISSRAFRFALTVALCACLAPVAFGVERHQRERALRAVVELVPLQALPEGGFSMTGYTVDGLRFVRANNSGSGSVISSAGLILTNAHVVAGGGSGPAPLVEVRMTVSPDLAARPAFLARVTHLDARRDLAALEIVADAAGRPVKAQNLTAIEIGDSDDLTLGDDLAVLGYPQAGGETITYTAGQVSGFVGENLRGAGRAFIKTDAKFSSGSSGGVALNEQGQLIGIPTAIAFDRAGGAPQESQNYLRPIAFALEMLKTPLPGIGATHLCLEASPSSRLRETHPWLFAGCATGLRPN